MFDALVVGNSILDQVWSSEQRLIVDDKITVRRFAKYPGGQAANAAYTMARLGLKVEFAGSFGEDVTCH